LLRFHPHPSQCRSIGQTIGLTAYPPQRAAIFTMPLLTRTCPAYFRLRALFEASDISTTSEPTVPSGIVSFGPADPVCARRLSCKGSLTPRLKSGACARPVMVIKRYNSSQLGVSDSNLTRSPSGRRDYDLASEVQRSVSKDAEREQNPGLGTYEGCEPVGEVDHESRRETRRDKAGSSIFDKRAYTPEEIRSMLRDSSLSGSAVSLA